MRGHRPLAAGAIAVVAALPIGCSTSHINPTAAPAGKAATSDVPSGCIETRSARHQIWHGSLTPAASKLGDALQHLADSNQDEVSGVAFCSDYSGVVMFLASPSSELLSAITSTQIAYPSVRVYRATVAAGLTAQLAAARRVVTRFATDITEVGPDIYTGGLSVSLSSRVPSSEQLRLQIIAVATSHGSVRMPVTFLPSSTGTLSAH